MKFIDNYHHTQVILNKDVSYQPDPILLEEPSHVMVNHLYAQVDSGAGRWTAIDGNISGHTRRSAGSILDTEVQEEVRDDPPLQTNIET